MSSTLVPIRFRFTPGKALAAIHMMVARIQPLDLHTMLKACYFADKEHLNQHERPIFGATYQAMKFGPVPLEIYEMAKAEPLWLAELGLERMPWRLTGYNLYQTDNETPNLGALSRSDREAISAGLARSAAMSFNERTAATHGSDWQAARLGRILYEDMIDDGPGKAELVAFLREAGPSLRL